MLRTFFIKSELSQHIKESVKSSGGSLPYADIDSTKFKFLWYEIKIRLASSIAFDGVILDG